MATSLGSFHRKGGIDIPVTDGGTGASDAGSALSNLNHGTTDHEGILGVGKLVKRSYLQVGTAATTTSQIPWDGTVPQNTEGAEFMQLVHTPLAAGNLLIIQAQASLSVNNTGQMCLALFVDAEAGARAAGIQYTALGNAIVQPRVTYEMTAPGTSPNTFRARGGHAAVGTTQFNADGTASPHYGSIPKSHILILEFTP